VKIVRPIKRDGRCSNKEINPNVCVTDDYSSTRSCFGKEINEKNPKYTLVYRQEKFGTRQRRKSLVNGFVVSAAESKFYQ
jgi:hypothetical protein